MTKCLPLLLLAVSPAFAQVVLVLSDGTPAPGLYDLGAVDSGQVATARLRLRNMSTTGATVSSLSLAGVGFSLTAPATPFGIPALGAVDFTVNFQATGTGSYSAGLRADGIAILLTASVLPSLTYRTDGSNGLALLTGLDFGAVARGTTAQRRVTVRNETAGILSVPPISVQGEAFALAAGAPSGQVLQPQQGGEFNVVFSPQSTGARQGYRRPRVSALRHRRRAAAAESLSGDRSSTRGECPARKPCGSLRCSGAEFRDGYRDAGVRRFR